MKRWYCKISVLMITVCVIVSVFAGCGGKSGTSAATDSSAATQQQSGQDENDSASSLKGNISAFIWLPDAPDVIQQQADDFMAKNPDVKIDLQMMTGNSTAENLQPKVASKSLPDLMCIDADEFGYKLAADGLLADLGDTKCWDNMIDSMKSTWTSANGTKFGISGGVCTTLIYYNNDLFKKAGVTEIPQDWDSFLAACEKLKSANITPIVWYGGYPNMLDNGPFSYGIANNLASKDPDFQKKLEDGSLSLNTPEFIDIFSKVKLIADKGYANKGYMSTDNNQGIQLFTQGKAAMLFEGTWTAGSIMTVKDMDVGVFLPPWNAKGQTAVPVMGTETGWAVAANDNAAIAKAFLDFINGEDYSVYQNKRQSIPPFKSPEGNVVVDSKVKTLMDEINSKYTVTSKFAFQVFSATIDSQAQKELQDVLTGALTPEKAAEQLDKANKDYVASKK